MSNLEQPTQVTQLLIVRRGRDSTYRLLERHFGKDPSVRIIWDRRNGARRDSTVWPSTDYLVVNLG